jgi:Zn-dependent M16 (insulinase) family peptidase
MISKSVAREEQWRGVSQLLFLEETLKGGEAELSRVAERLEAIRRDLLGRTRMITNATATGEAFGDITAAVDAVGTMLPAGSVVGRGGASPTRLAGESLRPSGESLRPSGESLRPSGESLRPSGESLVYSAAVGCVARAVPGFRYEDPLNGSGAVLGHLLSTGYLWEKIRMEGGAYGAFSYPRNMDGLFLFGSYRDPHITSTIKAFVDGLSLMETGPLSDDEVEKAVIGTVGREDRPIDPGERGFVSLQRKLHGLTDAARQSRRTMLLSVDRTTVGAAARVLREGFPLGFTAVIANQRSLEEASADNPELAGRVLHLPE